MKRVLIPRWQAATPRPMAIWVLPTPEGPSAIMFSRRATNSPRASSSTNFLLSLGIASKSKLSRVLCAGNRCRLDPPIDHAGLAVEKLQLDQPRQIADMIDVLIGALPRDLLMLAQDRGQF